jgi:hypothetical protein
MESVRLYCDHWQAFQAKSCTAEVEALHSPWLDEASSLVQKQQYQPSEEQSLGPQVFQEASFLRDPEMESVRLYCDHWQAFQAKSCA